MAMAQQEDGWPLGLQPLNVRVGLVRNPDFSGSVSFSTLLTGSPTSSTDSSSDLDTESTGSFFHDKSITLGNLIGANSVLDLSGRSGRARRPEAVEVKRSYRSKPWFSICTSACVNAESPRNGPSLGHFLEVERRAATVFRRNRPSMSEELIDEISGIGTITQSNSLFVNDQIAPPQVGPDGSAASSLGSVIQRRNNRDFNRGHGHGPPILLLSCICAQTAN